MHVSALIGLAVAIAGFMVMQFVVLKYIRRHTLPALVAFVGIGLAAPSFMHEPVSTLYQLGWMLGMCICVLISLVGRIITRSRRG